MNTGDLVKKIKGASSEAKQSFLYELNRGFVNPNQKRTFMPYLKGEKSLSPHTGKMAPGLTQEFRDYFSNAGVAFDDLRKFERALYDGEIYAKPLRRAYRGLLSDACDEFGNPSKIVLPREILQSMVDNVPGNGMSMIYLLAGRWRSNFKPHLRDVSYLPEEIRTPDMEVLATMRSFVRAGLDEMVEAHNKAFRDKEYDHPRKRYEMPFGKKIVDFFYSTDAKELGDYGH